MVIQTKQFFIAFTIVIGTLLTLYTATARFGIHKEISSRLCTGPFTTTTVSSQTTVKKDCITHTTTTTFYEKPIPYLETKRSISKKLASIYLELNYAVTHKLPPKPKVLQDLKAIISDLDPAFKTSQDEKEPVEPKNVNSSVLLDACPEKYMGEKFGYPFYQKGWQLQSCSNVKPLEKVVSIAVNTMEYPEPMEKQVETVLKGINQAYPKVSIFLAAKTSQIKDAAAKYPNVKTIDVAKGSSLGKVWNQLINEVATPYTLVARDIVFFNWAARIERQIHMLSTTEHVAVVGGSFRNLTGHWRVGCRQTKLFNYVLEYEEGYHYSKHSCMFCDDLEGPFVAKTNLLKSLKFSEKYSKEIIFEEFFLRTFQAGNLIMNCPDAMYYTTDYSTEAKHTRKAVWNPLATALKVVRVVFLDYGIRHKFSCGEISFKCSPSITKYVALPMCCLEQFGNAMKFFDDMSKQKNIFYELDAGSILASVKFNNYSPFDLDGDMIVWCFNMTTLNKNEQYAAQHGVRLTGYKPPKFNDKGTECTYSGYYYYYSPDIYTEVWGYPFMSHQKISPPEFNKPSLYTKCKVNNFWINCVHFPGMYARNRYGPDVMKHSQSWIQVGGMKDSWQRYRPGQFLPCNDPNFHSCLDKFPGDGNIAFKVL